MSNEQCPKCGIVLPANAPAGVCPQCLLAVGLERDTNSQFYSSETGSEASTADRPLRAGFVPPAVAQLAGKFPQFEIIELLGHGGMGAVYKARQSNLDRLVALKIIRPESTRDAARELRFNREAKALARLSHQNIVTIYDYGAIEFSDGKELAARPLYYFIMEYVDGANLRQLMQSGKLSPEQALAIVPQICDALQYAHDEGIVHRDIKPENIMLDRRGRVKIADYGLAKLVSGSAEDPSLTGTHQVMGTVRYMAPEQMEASARVDHRADIYSLGIVFYEMLTGEVPIGHFDPPSRKVQLDVRLNEVVLRSLAREPDRRYQQASEIKTDVEAIVSSVAPSTAPNNVSEKGTIVRRAAMTWLTLPKFYRLVIRGILVILTLVCLLQFLSFGANYQPNQFSQHLGSPDPWYSIEISKNGTHQELKLGTSVLFGFISLCLLRLDQWFNDIEQKRSPTALASFGALFGGMICMSTTLSILGMTLNANRVHANSVELQVLNQTRLILAPYLASGLCILGYSVWHMIRSARRRVSSSTVSNKDSKAECET